MTPEQHSLVRWMLEHGSPQAARFLSRLDADAPVVTCVCGCASFSFADAGPEGMDILADYFWRDAAGHLSGVYLYARGEGLAELDVWSIDGQGELPAELPPIERLRPLAELTATPPPA